MERYKVTKKIGAGSFGTAQLALVRATGAQVVIKLVDVRELSDEERRAAKREASILSALHHPCILAHIESFEDNGFLCICTEFCERGDLGARLEERKGRPLGEAQVLDYFTQIALGMLYCHKKRVLHRDLKLANVFLAADNSVKLGDFGIARVLKNTMEVRCAPARLRVCVPARPRARAPARLRARAPARPRVCAPARPLARAPARSPALFGRTPRRYSRATSADGQDRRRYSLLSIARNL
jgi:serine/threonine protein kinase